MLVEERANQAHPFSSLRGTLLSLHQRAERWATTLDKYPALIVLGLLAIYLGFVQIPAHRILWHDELFTFYIAKSRTLHDFLFAISRLDLNPPLSYLFTRVSQELFGDSPFATRIPFMAGFFGASIAFMYFLARRTGILWGAVAVLIIWYSPFFQYATEARAYAIVLAFFAMTLISWDVAADDDASGRARSLALAGVLIGSTGMMLTHVFAVFSLLPFYLAELVRWYRTRKIDWALWACLILPLGVIGSYIPLVRRFHAEAFPYQFQGSINKMVAFYTKRVINGICPGVLAGLVAALAVTPRLLRKEERVGGFRLEHLGLLVGIMLPPILINLMLMRSHGAFWERYCITTAVAIYVVTGLFIAYQVNYRRSAAIAAGAAILLIAVGNGIVVPYIQERGAERVMSSKPIWSIRPDLPFVTASGLTFMALDHNEQGEFLKRVYYLTDRESALKYVHATLFEGIAVEKNYFPIRGTVVPYHEFISKYKHFVTLGTMYYEEDWLLRKLQDDGAQLTYFGEYNTPYKDHSMYDVVIPVR